MSGPLATLGNVDWSRPTQELDRLKSTIESWTKAQPPYVEVGLATLGGSTQGAVLGGVMGYMTRLDPEGAGKLLTPPGNDAVGGPHFMLTAAAAEFMPCCVVSKLGVSSAMRPTQVPRPRGWSGALALRSYDIEPSMLCCVQMAKQMQAMQSQSPLLQARNFAVMTGVNAGAALAIKHARGGVEDVRGA